MKRLIPILGLLSLLYLPTALADPSGWWRHAKRVFDLVKDFGALPLIEWVV